MIALEVVNPSTETKALITGFRSVSQAKNIGLLRQKIKHTVLYPKVRINPDVTKYEYVFPITQKEIEMEVKLIFELL